jgi:trans-2,3-dihydro-3-hydroxyanthranilate isomerase
MKNQVFYIVDVFAEKKYAGNQLAVVTEAKSIADSDMQKIAKEMNYSETTFILSEKTRNGGYDVRIFTPENELPFAGHPTLGTAYVIQQEIIKEPVDTVVLNLKVGQIPVTILYHGKDPDMLWMKQINPTFGRSVQAKVISLVLSIDEKDIDERFPIQEVSTGTPTLIVPLRNLEAVKKSKIDKDQYYDLVNKIEAKGILIFSPETYHEENDLKVRFFADYYGVPEDPATGSANGCLAGYLAKHRYFGNEQIETRVEQGYEIGRPSLLLLKAENRKDAIDVFVGGKVFMIAKGVLL